jgi:hypothetical protein
MRSRHACERIEIEIKQTKGAKERQSNADKPWGELVSKYSRLFN